MWIASAIQHIQSKYLITTKKNKIQKKKRKGKNETKSTNNETEEKLFKVKTAKSHSTRRKDNIELKPSMKNRTLYLLENRNKKKIGCMVKEEKKKVNNLSRPLK